MQSISNNLVHCSANTLAHMRSRIDALQTSQNINELNMLRDEIDLALLRMQQPSTQFSYKYSGEGNKK